VPTLISTVGPMIAKGVMSRLSPKAARAVRRIAGPVGGAVLPGGGRPAPGANIQSILQMLLQALGRGGGESGEMGEADPTQEAYIEQAAATIEVIIGNDDRIRIHGTTQVPWRRYCALRMTFPSGRTYRGTGWFVGPRSVVTAGHCVYLHAQGGWARSMEVIPGMNGTARPYGSANAVSLRSVGGWVNGKKPESDYGCVVLPSGAFGGRNLGRFGFAALSSATLLAQPAVLAGYPGDKPFAEMWGMKRAIKSVTAKTLVYDIDTMGGQSGAPVYIKRNGVRYVVGIHNYGAASGNSATRVTEPVYRRLLAWSQIT
jgi:V8-like Glu-specific endopeptidase